MGKIILYGKIGRSMPLTLDKCGVAGGDQEMTAVVSALARRHPDDTFVLIGRNTGEEPVEVGLPPNVVNPWVHLGPPLRRFINEAKMNHANLTSAEQLELVEYLLGLTMTYWHSADAVIMWAGQHGTTNTPIPQVKDRSILTKPQDSFAYYAGYILRGINHWRDVDPFAREEIWLNADPRNYLKMRDLKWPLRHPVLAQFNYTTNIKHERYGDPNKFAFFKFLEDPLMKANYTNGVALRSLDENLGYEEDANVWKASVRSVYSRIELNLTVPGTPSGDHLIYDNDWDRPHNFGLIINEARAIGVKESMTRLTAMKKWVLPLEPAFIHGQWSEKSQAELGLKIEPLEWRAYTRKIQTARCTFTTPSSGSGWSTTKPWESFALGTVCFFHPDYDTQNNILGDAPKELREWLRVKTPEELQTRVSYLNSPLGRDAWNWLVSKQRAHYELAIDDPTYLKLIEDRIYGGTK